jgi:CheY-like chemotaxis protein
MLAAESAAGEPFNAVILDLTVSGGMGGLETLAAIRKLDASIPVFLASGYAGGPVISDPDTLGFSGGIGKPFTLAELAGLLRPVSRGSDKGRTRDH